MTKLNMKIHSYDEIGNSFLVSFSTDMSAKTVDEYQKYAFQTHRMGVTDPNDVIKSMAMSGLRIAQQQDMEDTILADKTQIDKYKDLVGGTFTIDESEIIVDQINQTNLTTVV